MRMTHTYPKSPLTTPQEHPSDCLIKRGDNECVNKGVISGAAPAFGNFHKINYTKLTFLYTHQRAAEAVCETSHRHAASRGGVGFGTAVWLIKQNNYMNKIKDSTRRAPLQKLTSWSQITPLKVTEQYEVTQLAADVNPYQQAPKITGSLFEAWLRQKLHCQVPWHFTPFCRLFFF